MKTIMMPFWHVLRANKKMKFAIKHHYNNYITNSYGYIIMPISQIVYVALD